MGGMKVLLMFLKADFVSKPAKALNINLDIMQLTFDP